MKEFYRVVAVLAISCLSTSNIIAQQSVSIGTTTIDANAVLVLVGDGKQGVIIPKTGDLNGMPKKAGMVVYNESDGKVYSCDGNSWSALGGGAQGTTPVLQINGNQVSIFSGQNVNLAGTAPTQVGQLFMWDGTKWTSTSAPANPLSAGQVLTWTGTSWQPQTLAAGGTVTNVTGTAPITVTNGTTTPVISLANTSVTPGNYGNTNVIPQLAIDAQGRVTAATNINIQNANATTTGLLSSADWTTFNNKLGSGTTAGGDLTGTYPSPTLGTGVVTSTKIADGTITAADLSAMGATNGQVLTYNGSSWTPATASGLSSTLTSSNIFVGNGTNVATGVPLTGDISITSAGLTSITNAAASGTNIISAINNGGATGSISEARLANITTAGKVSGGAITSGTIAGSTAINSTGNITTTGTLNTGAATFSTLTVGSTTINWPVNASGVLTNNGTGTLTWATSSVVSPANMVISGNTGGTAQVASSIFDNGTYTGVGRTTPVSSSGRLDVDATGFGSNAYGGMNVQTDNQGSPYYGYGNNGGTRMWTYYHGVTGSWRVWNGGVDRLTVASTGQVGIGTTSPTATLDVVGTIRVADGSQGAGKVLTSDGTGIASWQAVSGTGTVTNVATGVGLTGGPITTTGTLAVDVGTAANQIPQLDGGGKLNASILPTTVDVNTSDDITTASTAAGDVTGTFPTLSIANSATTGNNIITAINSAGVGTIPVSRGGTGANTTPLSGQLLIGNGAGYTAATLTAGTNVSITNGAGSITINSTGLSNPMTAPGDIIYGGASGAPTKLVTGTGFLKGGATPTYASINLASADVSGILPVANGGTGASTLTGILSGNGTSAVTTVVHSAPNQYLRRNSANTAYEFGDLTLASGDIVDGTIMDIDVSASAAIAGTKISPTFGSQNITTTGATSTAALTASGAVTLSSLAGTGNRLTVANATGILSTVANGTGVLTNDGTGNLSWVNGSGWSLAGNALSGGEKLGSTNGNPLPFITNNIERMRIDAAGNVGIGTATPLTQLDVYGTASLANIDLSIAGGATKLRSTAYSSGAEFGTVTNHPLNIFTNNTARLTIDAAGKVGFGTTAPVSDIQIGNTAHLFDFPNAAALSYNLYENGGNLFHTTAGGASVVAPQNDRVGMYVNAAGAANASFGSTLTNRMVMTATGVSINKDSPDPSAVLQVVSGTGSNARGFMMPSVTTTDRDLIVSPLTGLMVFNQTTNNFNYYNGSNWQVISGALGAGNGLTVNGANLDLGSLTMNSITTFKSSSDNLFELYSAAAASGTKAGFNLRMQDSYTGRQYEVISRKSDATANSGSSDFLINTLFSTGGGYIEAFKIDGASSDVIVNGAKTSASAYGNFLISNGNVGIGTTTPTAKLDLTGTLKIVDGTQGSGKVLTSDASGNATWQPAGAGTGWTLIGNGATVDGTNFIGTTDNVPFNIRVNNQKSGRIDPTLFNTFFGYKTGTTTTSSNNSSFGNAALEKNVAGDDNTAMGYNAMNNNTSSGSNTAVGRSALFTQSFNNGGTVFNGNNVAIGHSALYYNQPTSTSTGVRNTAVGSLAGVTTTGANANVTGSNNTFIGYGSGPASATQLTNATALGYSATVGASNSLVLGGTGSNTVNVGIGTTTPTARLEVIGGDINTDGEINRSATGAANLVPIAYGSVNSSGTLGASSGNVSVNAIGSGDHEITISGETYTDTGYITTVTLLQNGVGGQQNFYWTMASSGKLKIKIVNASGSSPSGVWTGYHFVVYKP